MKPASSFLITTLDLAIFLGQMIMLVIAYETSHYHPDLPDPLAPTQEPKVIAGDGEPSVDRHYEYAETRSYVWSFYLPEESGSLLNSYERPEPSSANGGPVMHLGTYLYLSRTRNKY